MTKLSKSDQGINRNENQEAAERAANPTRSTHFEVGTFVTIAHRGKAEVLARPGNGFMLVRWEDDTTEILRPQALAYESKVR